VVDVEGDLHTLPSSRSRLSFPYTVSPASQHVLIDDNDVDFPQHSRLFTRLCFRRHDLPGVVCGRGRDVNARPASPTRSHVPLQPQPSVPHGCWNDSDELDADRSTTCLPRITELEPCTAVRRESRCGQRGAHGRGRRDSCVLSQRRSDITAWFAHPSPRAV
jgi:hypothetical protein